MSEHETTVFSRVSPVRGQCLIIQGLPESTASASKGRVSADLQHFQCLPNGLLRPNEEVSVLKAFRLGKRSIDISEHSRHRPLQIVLSNQEQVGLILSRRFRIKDTNRGVFFSAGLHTGRENKTSTISSGTENKVAEWRDRSCDLQQPDSAAPSPNPLDRTDPDEGTVVSLNGIPSGTIIKRPKTLKLTFFYTNVQSILPKLDELKIDIYDLSPDVASLTETWLSENVDDRELMLPGFQLFQRDRRERQGGGVVTYVKDGLLVSEKTEQFACSAETIWLTIGVPRSHSLEVLTVYRPPRNDPEADARLLEELGRFALRPDVLIMGDFNAPLINWSSLYARGTELAFDRHFLDMALRSFLTQHVLFPTRAREGQQSNCLDLVLTKSMHSIDELWSVIRTADDEQQLQANINRLQQWSQAWLLPFNEKKCNILRVGRARSPNHMAYCLNGIPLQEVDSQKDLGVWITTSLKPSLHYTKIVKSAMSDLYLVKWAFSAFDEDCFAKVFRTFVRPQLEFAIQAWRPWTAKDLSILERVQRRATKLVAGQGSLPYATR
nr:unnamed protein product [Spirometra erinaceieuropaei]